MSSLLFCKPSVGVATGFIPSICKGKQTQEAWQNFSDVSFETSLGERTTFLSTFEWKSVCYASVCMAQLCIFSTKKGKGCWSVCSQSLPLFSAAMWAQQGTAHLTLPFMVQVSHHILKERFPQKTLLLKPFSYRWYVRTARPQDDSMDLRGKLCP